MARTTTFGGRSWSHQQMHGLLKALVDNGWGVEFYGGVYYNFGVYRDGVAFEQYNAHGLTMWEALCNTMDKMAEVDVESK
jgi:hypothetical protein